MDDVTIDYVFVFVGSNSKATIINYNNDHSCITVKCHLLVFLLSSDVDMLMTYSLVFSIVVVKFIEVYCLYDGLLFLRAHYNSISVQSFRSISMM